MRDARLWMQDILAGGDAGKSDKDRRTLANDITQLRLLSTHVPFDTSNLRWTAGAVRAMQDRVAALTPIVSAVEDRMRALQADGQPLPENVTRLLASISKWIDAGPRATMPPRCGGRRPADAGHRQPLQLARRAAGQPDDPAARADRRL